MAITSFNNPKETHPICSEVKINIEDETTNGFLSKDEVKIILEKIIDVRYCRTLTVTIDYFPLQVVV